MRSVLSLFVYLLLLSINACSNPFNPKMAVGDSIGLGLPNTTPYNVLRNLEIAYNQKNLDLYISTLDRDFLFSVSPDDENILGETWWGYDVEIEFHRNLFTRGSTNRNLPVPNMIILNLNIPPETEWIDDRLIGHEDWIIIRCGFYLRLSFTSTADLVASGSASFHMKPVDGSWFIGKWIDESN